MRPTLTEGLVLAWNELPHTRLQAEYLVRVLPRSTVGWFRAGESIGLYSVGVDADGMPSQYWGNTDSKGIFQLGVAQRIRALDLQIWNTFVENVFDRTYRKAELTFP